MRLVHAGEDGRSLSLQEFFDDEIPEYAILSHTWYRDSEEVSYQDFINDTGKHKRGYGKIQFCAKQVISENLKYFWVDTCCRLVIGTNISRAQLIEGHAELTESINSMFEWYKQALVCYVWLDDLASDVKPEIGFPSCRWFSRGWTLQELLAPNQVEFYNHAGDCIGSKQRHADIISKITRIPRGVLFRPQQIFDETIATRMSWASKRKTKRREDIAYSLLGIFDVYMPLIYGEGVRAFRRLQEEIIKRHNDLSIFAWISTPSHNSNGLVGTFASSPTGFAECPDLEPHKSLTAEFALTNRGLLLTGHFELYGYHPVIGELQGPHTAIGEIDIVPHYVLIVGKTTDSREQGIYLRKLGPGSFCRIESQTLVYNEGRLEDSPGWMLEKDDKIYILADIPRYGYGYDMFELMSPHRHSAIKFPRGQRDFKVYSTAPLVLWDQVDALFLRPKPHGTSSYTTVLAAEVCVSVHGHEVMMVVVHDGGSAMHRILTFKSEPYAAERDLLFQGRVRNEGISWKDLMNQAPRLSTLKSSINLKLEQRTYKVGFSLRSAILHMHYSKDVPVDILVSSIEPV
ncbi:hypothetical protein CUC08_Gglean003768 [Alternaria sp. MG1]|nr:hypothetical protein CUC08_Gglean003768 [Alternaria sp. MG1]